MALGCQAASATQEPQITLKAIRKLLHGDSAQPGGGKLDAEGQRIDGAAGTDHRARVGNGDIEGGVGGAAAGEKQHHRGKFTEIRKR